MNKTAIIVDDEQGARESLNNLVERFCDGITILDTCDSAESAFASIQEHQPDIVFLDIEMPNENAFDLLNKFDEVDFDIIFTTAYDHYAIQAIKFSAFDYLLKPIDIDDLQLTIERYLKQQTPRQTADQHKTLLDNIKQHGDKKLAIADMESLSFVKIKDIVRLESDGNYTKIFTDKTSILASKTLGDFEELLIQEGFFRTHRKHLINLARIDKYIKGEGGHVILDDGSTIEVSRRKKSAFMESINQ